ncbi:fungal-specific transcription factor domain-containing protein [Phellopilus nigrolimitatus]|nr:fungal-specific transcription factor domain-containing protein [Phellopilus nigrolimitatus]
MVLPNVMLGGYAPHAHQQQALHAHGGGGLGHHGHGHGAQQNAYSLHAVGGHHGGGGGGHNGHNAHGNSGQASSSSSWNNHVRTSAELAHQQTYQQQHQQHQQTQQMLHEQYLLHYPYGPENKGIERRNVNHTNESGALSYPNASPTVRMPSLPPPLHSSFSRHYTADVVAGYDMEMDSDMEGQFAGVNVTTNGIGEGALLPFYDQQAPADLHSYNMYDLSEQQQYHQQQQFLSLPAPLVDPLFADRRDGDLVHHYMLHVRPVQYFFADSRVDELLLHLARDVPTLRDAMCFVASVHQRRMREGGSASSGSSQGSATPSPARAALQLPAGTSGAPEADDRGATYHVRAKNALVHRADAALSKGEAMAGLQCVSSFLFAGGVGEWDWFLEVAVRWVQAKVLAPAAAAEGGAREWLARMAREDEMAGWIVRITMWFEVLASVTQVRPPRFLEAYRDVFGCASARVVEVDVDPAINGGAEADFSMLTVMGCDNRTFVALAEISALAAWKEEQTKRQKLSSVELVRRGFAIEEKYLLRTMDAEGDLPRTAVVPAGTTYSYTDGADSLENRRRLTADIFRASARLYLHTVLSGDKPSVSEIADGVRETVEALERVPGAPASLRRSVVRSVVFPICLAGCMTDDAGQRGTLKQVLESEGGAGNCGEVVKVMEAGAVAGRRGGGENVVADQGLPLLLV